MNRLSSGANSLSLRLLALIVVPLLGLAILAVQRIDDDRDDARTARELVEAARLEQAVAAVYTPAQLEQIALEGFASIDRLGVDRDLVVSFTGVDFAIYDDNEIVLDAALDAVDDQFGDLTLSDGRPIDVHLDEFRAALDDQRELSDARQAQTPEVRAVFARLDGALRDAVAVAGLSGDTTTGNRELSLVSTLLHTAGDRGRALLEGLIDQSPERAEPTLLADARVDVAAEQLRTALSNAEAEALDALFAELAPLPASIVDVSITDGLDGEYIQDSATAVLNQLDFLESLQRYSAELHDGVVVELEADALAADAATDRTQMLALATVLVSLILLLVIALSILHPLRRLTRRAEVIGSGDFDGEPLPLRGPSDVRVLTTTVNEMADTLAGVDREIARLADGGSLDSERQLPGAIGESIDRSFRRLSSVTDQLHASETLASAIVAHAADAIWTIDATGTILSANDASEQLLGLDSADQIGGRLDEHLRRLDGETTLRRSNGETAHVVVSSSEIGVDGVVAVMAHDVSDRRRFQERLSYQAHHDALTGLPNRLAVLEALDQADADRALAALFVDLDGFKSVNDMQGHLVGDRVLTEVGRRLRQQVRSDDVVGRLGGDEFVVVMSDVESDLESIEFAERLVTALEEPYRDGSSVFTLSASVGVATFLFGLEAEGLTAIDAIRRADGAVYAAKARGRGNVELFDAELEARLTRDAEIEHSLRAAIADDELEVYLQPVLDLTTGTFASAEALVRWNRPGVGMLSPGDFIPIAERSSLIQDVGRWVLHTTCRTLASWSTADPHTTASIAVNIAGSHLLDGDLVADVDAALDATGADPAMLAVELTESQLMDDIVRAKAVLERLRSRGIRIAIDDFGTGYSSLAYLRELPIDTLKIDRSFIAPIENSDSDTTVIEAMLTVGHALGMSIVAEGIETGHQLSYLTGIGCDRAQGFLMARPMPIDQATPLVGAHFADLVGSG